MIGTILAHELRSTRKTFLTTGGVLLLIAVVSLALGATRLPVVGIVGNAIGMLVGLAFIPVFLGLLVENYWRTMYGREGHFTMTLPVHGRALFAAKVLYAIAIAFTATALAALVVVSAVIVMQMLEGAAFADAWGVITGAVDAVGASLVWFLVVSVALYLVYLIISTAAIMSIGAQARFNHLGFGAPVIGVVLLYVVMQAVGFAAMLFIPFGIRLTGPDAGTFVAQGMFDDFVSQVAGATSSDAPAVFGLGILVVSLIATVLFAWLGARSVELRTSLR